MTNVSNILELINNRIESIELKKPPVELYEPIRYTLQLGGKRMRPALCLMACDMFGGDIHGALDVATGIEIFHNFTLLHDDIMDKAPLRRGKKTVHSKWNANVAILSGDTMMALAYEYVMKAPPDVRSEVFANFNKTAIEVCEGQQYDMNFETGDAVTLDDYMDMIRLKTAVLLAASLKIGALVAGASQKNADLIYLFGEAAGIAFQLKDDLLDAFGDDEKFGKIKGGDIIANKKTFLYLKALDLADSNTQKQLKDIFQAEFSEPGDKVSLVLAIYEKLNMRSITENEMAGYYSRALAALESLDVDETKKAGLKSMAADIIERKF
jgi:geranylgeranyl diphosphate synthase, type II